MLPLAFLLGLRVEHRHIKGSVPSSFLRLDWRRARLLSPAYIQPPEDVHAKALVVNTDGFRCRPKHVALRIAVIKWPAILSDEDVLVLPLARCVGQRLAGETTDLPHALGRFALGVIFVPAAPATFHSQRLCLLVDVTGTQPEYLGNAQSRHGGRHDN
jgi:hypothetical protein